MRTESLLLVVTLLLTTTCHAHVINKRRQPIPILLKMDEITRHLRDLTTSMADFDMELRGALSADPVASSRLLKRSASDDDDKISCRLSLREDLCQALEMMKEREQSNYLVSPKSPGKRAGDNSPAKYQQMVSDLNQKRELLHTLRKVFDNAGHILEREKKWFTCKLNLGYTCQTQEYAAIADYYDFLNSADSPGKKRSSAVVPLNS